jgi:hypothetical protein
LDRLKKNKEQEKELIYQKMEKFIKENFKEIKKMDLEYKFILMVIYTLENFKIIKNMEMENSFGLVCHQKILNKMNLYSIIKVFGGVACLMVKVYIRKLMVIFIFIYFR